MENIQARESALPRYATPRPAMRGRYLIRNPRSAAAINLVDALLSLGRLRRRQQGVPSCPRRILLADWTHLGNIMLTIPALRLLRKLFPQAEIGFLAGSWSVPVIESTGLCDHLHLVDHFLLSRARDGRLHKIRRYFAMRRRAIAEIGSVGYEVAIDVDSHFPPAAPLLHAAGIPVRAGFTSGGFGPLLTHPVDWIHAPRPISDYSRDLFRALWPELELAPDALAPCYPGHPRVPPPNELAGKRYIVFHMGSGAPHKEWPEDRWQVVGSALGKDGWRIVLAGRGPREAERIRRVAAGLPAASVVTLIDQAWSRYVAVIAAAAHVVSLDSSSVHVAAAFSVPTTAIYGGMTDAVQMGPWNRNARVLTAPVGCAPCYLNTGCETMACIRGVTADQVIQAVRARLEGVTDRN